MKFGYFKHWFRPPYAFAEFLKSEGYDIEEIDLTGACSFKNNGILFLIIFFNKSFSILKL